MRIYTLHTRFEGEEKASPKAKAKAKPKAIPKTKKEPKAMKVKVEKKEKTIEDLPRPRIISALHRAVLFHKPLSSMELT